MEFKGDDNEWEVLDQAVVAVDYSNVQVFLKTLQEWQGEETPSSSESAYHRTSGRVEPKESNGNKGTDKQKHLIVNLDSTLAHSIFASNQTNHSPS